jgi:ketol-acid reductoisomerase
MSSSASARARLRGRSRVNDGLTVKTVDEAAEWADVIMLLVPDQHMGDLYQEHIAPTWTRATP